MNEQIILLDTNIIIYALKGDSKVFDFINKKKLAISFVSEIELLGWRNLTTADKTLIADFIKQCLYIDYSIHLKEACILVRNQYNLKLADAFIAATSIQFDIPLVSADNIFAKAKELNFIHLSPSS